jgi:hypothetical protein
LQYKESAKDGFEGKMNKEKETVFEEKRQSEGLGQRNKGPISKILGDLVDRLDLDRLADIFLGEEKLPTLSYESVIEYFSAHKKDSPNIVRGAMIKETTSNGDTLVSQVFLDETGKIVCDTNGSPIGRKVLVSGIDKELQNLFKGHEMVNVKLR